MKVFTCEELREELSKVMYQLDFERRKTDHLMKSIADLQRDLCRPHGIIHNDMGKGFKYTPFGDKESIGQYAHNPRRTVGASTVGYSIAFDVISVLVGVLVGVLIGHFLCK